MKKNDGNILYDQTDILEEVEHFYCNLYKQKLRETQMMLISVVLKHKNCRKKTVT